MIVKILRAGLNRPASHMWPMGLSLPPLLVQKVISVNFVRTLTQTCFIFFLDSTQELKVMSGHIRLHSVGTSGAAEPLILFHLFSDGVWNQPAPRAELIREGRTGQLSVLLDRSSLLPWSQ